MRKAHPQRRSAFAPAVGVKHPPNSPSTATDTPPTLPPKSSPSSTPLKKALVHFLSGGLSAGLVRFSLQPLDTIKTRLQASRAATTPLSLRTTLLQGQGVRGLYRGAIPGIVGIVPAAAVYMLTFQTLKHALGDRLQRNLRSAAVAMAAAIGDVAACLVRVPCEVMKQRLQVGVYSNLGRALKELGHVRRLGGLYTGLGAQLARDVPYAAVEFMFYERLKEGVGGEKRRLSRRESFVVGGMSGAVAAVASNPMDVVKTRLMTQVGKGGYGGVGEALVRVAREEGVGTFAKGVAPRIAAKTLQSALFFAVYESLKSSIGRALGVEMGREGE